MRSQKDGRLHEEQEATERECQQNVRVLRKGRAMGKQWVMLEGIRTCACKASALTPGLWQDPSLDKVAYIFFIMFCSSLHFLPCCIRILYESQKEKSCLLLFFLNLSFLLGTPSCLHLHADCSSNTFPTVSGNRVSFLGSSCVTKYWTIVGYLRYKRGTDLCSQHSASLKFHSRIMALNCSSVMEPITAWRKNKTAFQRSQGWRLWEACATFSQRKYSQQFFFLLWIIC